MVGVKRKTISFAMTQNYFLSSSIIPMTLAALCFVLSLYTYHSSKVTVPVLGLALLFLFWKEVTHHAREVGIALVLGALLLVPLAKDSLYGNGLTRAGSLAVSADNTLIENVQLVSSNFAQHLSPSFLLFGETSTLRHGDGTWGVLLPTTLLLVLFSLLASVLVEPQYRSTRVRIVALSIIFAGILPAALGDDVPHSNRALLALPGFLLLAAHGLMVVWHSSLFNRFIQKIFPSVDPQLLVKQKVGLLIGIHALLFISYLNHYYGAFAQASASDFKDGYLEAFERAQKYEKGEDGYPKADQIIFTDAYGQPYIYALYVRRTDPIWYQGGSLNHYLFTTPKVSDLERKNTLVVAGADEELPLDTADHRVYGSDGTIRFALFWTGE